MCGGRGGGRGGGETAGHQGGELAPLPSGMHGVVAKKKVDSGWGLGGKLKLGHRN